MRQLGPLVMLLCVVNACGTRPSDSPPPIARAEPIDVELRDFTVERIGSVVDLDAVPARSGQGYRARGTLVATGAGAQSASFLVVLRRRTTLLDSPAELAIHMVPVEKGTGTLEIVTVGPAKSPPQFQWEIIGVVELSKAALIQRGPSA